MKPVYRLVRPWERTHGCSRRHSERAFRPRIRSRYWFALAGALFWLAVGAPLTTPDTAGAAGGGSGRTVARVPQLRGVGLSPTRAFWPGPTGQSEASDAREVASSCQLGARIVRVVVGWSLLERDGEGTVDPAYAARLDSLMRQAAACGMRVLFTFAGTPDWDLAPTEGSSPADPAMDGSAGFRRMVSWVLHRWPELYALEVWNEPNLRSYWMGTPDQYADLVNAAVAAKHDVGARTLILGGALALGAPDYLQQLYAAGMRGEDGISLHPYSMTCTPGCQGFLDPRSRSGIFRHAIAAIHQVMLENHDYAGMWLTEFGFATCPSQPLCVPPKVQATWTAKSIQIAACYPYIAGLTAFTLRDQAVPESWEQSSWDFHFGLMGDDFTPKPAFGAVRATFRRLASDSHAGGRAIGAAAHRRCSRLLGKSRPGAGRTG